MEQLREEQGKLLLRQMNDILLRQNVRTAGKTYHTERIQLNHRGEVFKQNKPTIPEHMHHINPPRSLRR